MNDERLLEKQLDAFDRRMDGEEDYEVSKVCDICSSEICVGEEYYDVFGDVICNNCIRDYVDDFKVIAD